MIVYLARALRNGIIKRKSRRETQRERERTCLRLEEFGSEFDYLNSYQFLKKLFKEEDNQSSSMKKSPLTEVARSLDSPAMKKKCNVEGTSVHLSDASKAFSNSSLSCWLALPVLRSFDIKRQIFLATEMGGPMCGIFCHTSMLSMSASKS